MTFVRHRIHGFSCPACGNFWEFGFVSNEGDSIRACHCYRCNGEFLAVMRPIRPFRGNGWKDPFKPTIWETNIHDWSFVEAGIVVAVYGELEESHWGALERLRKAVANER